MAGISRRNFGRAITVGTLGGLADMLANPPVPKQGSGQDLKLKPAIVHELIKRPGITVIPCVYDAFTARCAERIGFECVEVAGSALGHTTCIGEPALSLEDLAQAVRSITAAVSIPVTVDGGAGYGEPAHVFHTVRVLEHSGACGVQIDDQIYPKRFHYHVGREHTISAEEMIEKIRAALEARRDPSFVIVGRTDTMRTHSYAEGIRRGNLYAEAGADVIHVFPNTPDEAKRTPKDIRKPLKYVNGFAAGGRPIYPAPELEVMGWKWLSVIGLSHVRYKAVRDVLVQLKKTGSTGLDVAEYTAIEKEIQEVIGLPEYYRIENETTEKS